MKVRPLILSATITMAYSILSIYLLFSWTSPWTVLIALPFTIVWTVGFFEGGIVGYFLFATVIAFIWFILYKVIAKQTQDKIKSDTFENTSR